MKHNKKTIISMILNGVIVFFVCLACFIMFTGIKFMHGDDLVLESTKLGMFRFFTVDSNCFMGIASLIYLIFEIYVSLHKGEIIPKWVSILKLMATSSVALTFAVVFAYLGPAHGLAILLMNSNLFFHLLIPVLSVFTYVFFERDKNIIFKNTFWGLLPVALYSVYYFINLITHMENGYVSTTYDWYLFFQNGIGSAVFVLPIILILSYGITYLLWKGHDC